MKTNRFSSIIIHFLLLLGAISGLVGALFLPWVYGRAVLGLSSKKVYLYQAEELHLVGILLPVIIAIILITSLYGLLSKKYFVTGILNGLAGLGTIGLSYYVWLKIDARDIHFLGVNPLKLAEVHPDIGVLFLFIVGFLLTMDGLACLFIRKLGQ